MIEEIVIKRKICDGCGTLDVGVHMSASHYTTEWSNIKGFDLCALCELKVLNELVEKAEVNVIEDIINTLPKISIGEDLSFTDFPSNMTDTYRAGFTS